MSEAHEKAQYNAKAAVRALSQALAPAMLFQPERSVDVALKANGRKRRRSSDTGDGETDTDSMANNGRCDLRRGQARRPCHGWRRPDESAAIAGTVGCTESSMCATHYQPL